MNVYTQSKVVKVDLVPSGTAYSANDVIGTAGGSGNDAGKIRLPNALREPTRSGILQSLTLFDAANQKPALTVLFFKGRPAGNFPDNSPCGGLDTGVDGSDLLLGFVSVASSDWVSITSSGNTTATASIKNIGLVVEPDTNGDIYAVFISGGTPDYIGSADELVANFGFIQD